MCVWFVCHQQKVAGQQQEPDEEGSTEFWLQQVPVASARHLRKTASQDPRLPGPEQQVCGLVGVGWWRCGLVCVWVDGPTHKSHSF